MVDVQPEIGDRVTFIDSDGDRHRALVVDHVPDAEYVTLVWGSGPELGEGYNHEVNTETSIYPHTSVGGDWATSAFIPGWGPYNYPEDAIEA